eukprot:TRINITY_DN1948_c0_g2_i2.p1 TRINITY_DN1948_c0_g2~~TRINITY_DN1948_c0_g2_i2.p1  ORF type:complete len:226 (+),score=57.49 TRINITY_DN1948_c0_g2_i2:80-757(+)
MGLNSNPPIPPSMVQTYNILVDELLSSVKEGRKTIVAIAGIPGSGKTTMAFTINKLINERSPNTSVMVPMDGFHYYRKQLDQMENPEEAHRRRGAPFTFWAEGIIDLIKRIRTDGTAKAPSFDHSVGDPVEDDIVIEKNHSIVIVEGIYLLLDEKPWDRLAEYFDLKWYIDCDINVAMDRVAKRHEIDMGLSKEAARIRADTNDRSNAEFIQSHRLPCDRIIQSM